MPELLGFSAEQVCRLTGLSLRQLSYWDATGFFSPEYGDPNRRQPYSRVYSFRDLVGLRVLAQLRRQYAVALQELRAVAAWLADQGSTPWATLRLYVIGRRVAFDDPRTGARLAARPPGQMVLPIHLAEIAAEVQHDIDQMRQRRPEDIGQITRHRYVVHNAPVLAGTRIPTSAIWAFHVEGYDPAAIIREYPRLTPADIEAAIAYEEQRRHQQAS
jgi:uncharacterized protein (DUF433 family)